MGEHLENFSVQRHFQCTENQLVFLCSLVNRANITLFAGTVIVDTGSRYNIHEVRIPNVQLNSDIYFLDGKRKHSVTNDEFGREIVI